MANRMCPQLRKRPLELELGCASSPPQRMPQPPERALRRCRATAVGGAEAAHSFIYTEVKVSHANRTCGT